MPAVELWDALTADPGRSATLRCWTGGRYEEAPWAEVVRDAEEMTAALRRAGVAPGERAAAVLTNAPDAVRGIPGVWLAGGSLASLPTQARGMTRDEYIKQLNAICQQLMPPVLLVDDELRRALAEPLGRTTAVRSWSSFAAKGRVDPAPPADDQIAFIQYSSGSTSMPKGCMLTVRAITAQLDLLEELMDPRPAGELGLSWMPLSHDMGMFGGLLACWWYGASFVLSSPQRFMFAPSTWLSDAARFRVTITGGPDTALRLAARAVRPHRLPSPLKLRICVVGAERVRADTLSFVTSRL